MGMSGQPLVPAALTQEKSARVARCVGVWVGLRAGKDVLEKIKKTLVCA
jgi:hypothetical protein